MSRSDLKIFLYWWELESMPEYSCSLPSETTIGKVWRCDIMAYNKRAVLPLWYVGIYGESDDPDVRLIHWHEVVLREGPRPAHYSPPDWHNTARWERERQHERQQRLSEPS